MTKKRILDWILSHWCTIDSRFFVDPNHKRWDTLLASGKKQRDDYIERINAARIVLSALPIYCTDRRRPTVDEVGAITARWSRKSVKLVALDYFERMQTGDNWKDEGIITAKLADIAARHDVAFIYADQLNKTAENSEGTSLMHARGSITRCADADVILQMRNVSSRNRKNEADRMAEIELLVVTRDGVSGKRIRLMADLSTGHFAGKESVCG